ncbi:hypothetical protein GJ496_001674 [Pomphorhynchus laevis]|nr:hypothetical protein GJ496_001674 [Pomphorhynchus laevis]
MSNYENTNGHLLPHPNNNQDNILFIENLNDLDPSSSEGCHLTRNMPTFDRMTGSIHHCVRDVVEISNRLQIAYEQVNSGMLGRSFITTLLPAQNEHESMSSLLNQNFTNDFHETSRFNNTNRNRY